MLTYLCPRAAILLLTLSGVLIACNDSIEQETTLTTSTSPTPSNGLQLTLNVGPADEANVSLGLILTNMGSVPRTFSLAGIREDQFVGTYDFVATRKGKDAVIWNWLHDKIGYDSLQFVTLAPGEEMSWHEVWEKKDNREASVEAGTYIVTGTLDWYTETNERNELRSAPQEIEVSG
jgi:hypothetical protein